MSDIGICHALFDAPLSARLSVIAGLGLILERIVVYNASTISACTHWCFSLISLLVHAWGLISFCEKRFTNLAHSFLLRKHF